MTPRSAGSMQSTAIMVAQHPFSLIFPPAGNDTRGGVTHNVYRAHSAARSMHTDVENHQTRKSCFANPNRRSHSRHYMNSSMRPNGCIGRFSRYRTLHALVVCLNCLETRISTLLSISYALKRIHAHRGTSRQYRVPQRKTRMHR